MTKKKRIWLIILIVAVLIAVVGFFMLRSFIEKMEANNEQLEQLTIENVDLNKVNDGTYEGTYESFPLKAVVTVTVKDHNITDITINEHDNGRGEDAERITGDIISEQSLNVDVITGATYSSKVILKAVEKALKNAD